MAESNFSRLDLSMTDCQVYAKIRLSLDVPPKVVHDELKKLMGDQAPSTAIIRSWQIATDANCDNGITIVSLAADTMGPTTQLIRSMARSTDDYDEEIKRQADCWTDIERKLREASEKIQYSDPKFGDKLTSIVYDTNELSLIEAFPSSSGADNGKKGIAWVRLYQAELDKIPADDRWAWLSSQRVQAVSDSNEVWTVFRDERGLSEEITQGKLTDCWFVSPMSLISRNSLLLHKIFPTPDFQAAGVYALNLCIDGRWQVIIIDDKVPMQNKEIVFSKAPNNQLWAPLVEKALAKAYGCYEALAGGLPREGLSTLTGEPIESLMLPLSDSEDSEDFWDLLLSSFNSNFLICAICQRQNVDYATVGLTINHVYAVNSVVSELDRNGNELRLLCLSNPWGLTDWRGPWSTNSQNWSSLCSDEVRHRLQSILVDGRFWMSYSDFLKFFVSVDICKIRHWHQQRRRELFYRPNFRKFAVVLVDVTDDKPVPVEIMLHQIGVRKKKPSERVILDLKIFVCSVTPMLGNDDTLIPVKVHETPQSAQCSTPFVYAGEFHLHKGLYAVFGFSYEALLQPVDKQSTEELCYMLSIYSKNMIFADQQIVQAPFLGKALISFTREHFDLKTSDKSIPHLTLYQAKRIHGIYIIMIENTSSSWQYVKLNASKSTNLAAELRGGSLVTVDIIPPYSCQIVQILKITGVDCRFRSGIYTRPAKPDEQRMHIHEPSLSPYESLLATSSVDRF